MMFLPCTFAPPLKNQNEESAELTEEERKENEEKKKRQAKNAAKEELDKKVTSFKKNVEQIRAFINTCQVGRRRAPTDSRPTRLKPTMSLKNRLSRSNYLRPMSNLG